MEKIEVRQTLSLDPARDLSIVILNWNSREHLVTCLKSLERYCPGAEVIVIDNASRDQDAIAGVCRHFGVDRFLPQSSNIGVAGGRNLGAAVATRAYTCSLDVDTEVTEGAMQALLEVLRSDPGVGLCAPQLRSFGGVVQLSCRQFPRLHTKLLRLAPGLDWWGALAREEMRTMDRSRAAYVDWVIGACQMYRSDLFRELGGYHCFSTFGSEDIDFCVRVWQSGLHVMYCPASLIYHWERRAARSLFRRNTFSHARSLWAYFVKHGYAFSLRRLYESMPCRSEGEVLARSTPGGAGMAAAALGLPERTRKSA